MNIQIGKREVRARLLGAAVSCVLGSIIFLPTAATAQDLIDEARVMDANAPDAPAGSLFRYLNIAGSTFHPLDNSTTYSYPGDGCIAKTGGSDARFVHKGILPAGAVARYVRLYYYDTSTSNVVAFFTTYDGAGNYNERTSVSSVGGASGYDSTLSPVMNYTVAPSIAAINVVVNLGDQDDETLQFCGVRIAYEAPILDRIFISGFETLPL